MNAFKYQPVDRAVRLAAAYFDMTAEHAAHWLNLMKREGDNWKRVLIQADQLTEEEIARFLTLQDTLPVLEKLIRQAIEVRTLQKTYFRTRLHGDLVASKAAEKAFDDAAALFLNPPAQQELPT